MSTYTCGMLGLLRGKVSDLPMEQGAATYLNPYSYLRLRRFPGLLERMDRVYLDGAAMVLALRMVGVKVARRSMDLTSMAPDVLGRASLEGRSVAFVGSEPGVAEQAVERLQSVIGPLKVVRVRDGYFTGPEDWSREVQGLVELSPDVVLVGMGTPLQERFLADLTGAGWRGAGFTCGGFLHQTAPTESGHYYPRLFRRARWLYRMIDEPRLARRYLLQYPWFVVVFTIDALRERVALR